MTISNSEKIKLVMAKDWWETEDLGGKLEKVKVSDGPVGLRCLAITDSWENDSIYPSVAYPCYQMLSQTWDTGLAWEMGRAIADDCIDHNVDVLLGPGVNIKRTPLCGRNFEYFSEDPYVAGMFGKSFIEGVQAGHVGTSLKHYCCNNREYSRYWLSSEIDARTLREIYLKPFEIALKAKPWTVMTSYNLVNGVRMSANQELNHVLREELGFDGVIVSDWEAVQDPLDSLHAGLDLEFPHNAKHAEQMQQHLKDGKVDLACLETSANRMLALSEKNQEAKKNRNVKYTVEERIAISQKVEENGIVLLKNNGVLPLQSGKVCVTGAPSHIYYHGGGSSAVKPNRPFVPLYDALSQLGYDAFYTESIGKVYGSNVSMGNLKKACLESADSDVTILTVGTGAGGEVEETDRRDITLTPEELDAVKYLRKYAKKLVVVVYAGSAVDLSRFDELADAVVLAGFGGQNVSQAVANVLAGKVNPSGRLTETYAYSIKDIPSENTRRDEACMYYDETWHVGYRHFATENVPVLYPFGYGLSYTEFAYSNLQVCGNTISVDVENVGKMDGKEVVQLYVAGNREDAPVRELKAFQKVFIKAGEKVTVTMELDQDAFKSYDVQAGGWQVQKGEYALQICKNANEILLQMPFVV
ncbi:MAG: glycoside hydrolase family 3 C-terminal domain-containing protein [Oscillospiraceae bacterium]|nr:glycoside hydrolase family 3 C-terminal domain-containing protein [Oscillospiraceae bacterium]